MSQAPVKPPRLRPGDTVAIVSPSWGGPSRFPRVYELGLQNLRELLGVEIREFPTARMDADELYRNPRLRADDLNAAFGDPSIKAIFATIGGDDSVRVLPFLEMEKILANPKILMGYSDTTTFNCYLATKGMVTFNGPAIMAGFAQMQHLPAEFGEHVRAVLTGEVPDYRPFRWWCGKYRDWALPDYNGEIDDRREQESWQWLQGSGRVEGRLFGGCIEVLEFLKGTTFWPGPAFWDDKILFFETSEDEPTVDNVKYMLRNYGSMGVLDRVRGVLFGRARGYSADQKERLYKMLVQIVAGEFGRDDMPIVANLDFGHTDPQWVMPLGLSVEISVDEKRLRALEAATV